MRAFALLSVISSFGVLLCTASGCAGHASTTSSTSGASAEALDAPNGGLSASDEAPGFGDSSLAALTTEDSAYADSADVAATSGVTVQDLPLVPASAQKPGTGYHVLLLWGHLPPPKDASDDDNTPNRRTDWTGAIRVDAGGIGLRRTIAFDANDSIERPRTSAESLGFVSHTSPFVDGLLVRIVIPTGAAPTLHFDTDALKTDIDLSDLPLHGGGVIRLPNAPDVGLAWAGFRDDGCAKGFLFGRWVKDRANLGRFRARVLAADGEHLGHLRGLWGHAPKRDKNVFFGKFIDKAGHFDGLTAGTYGNGRFQGIWAAKDESDVDVGTLEGFYSDGYDKDDGRGVTVGRWVDHTCKK